MKISTMFLISLSMLVFLVGSNQAQETRSYKLVKINNIENIFSNNQKSFKPFPLIGRGSSYGYGQTISNKATAYLRPAVSFFLCTQSSILYFDKTGELIRSNIYQNPEGPVLVSPNGKYILVSNSDSGISRMETAERIILWEKEIPRLTKFEVRATTPGRVSNEGILVLEINPCNKGQVNCEGQKIEIYDRLGLSAELGTTTSEQIHGRNITGNMSSNGRYYAINCVVKLENSQPENVVTLYDLETKSELWRNSSQVNSASNIFVTNDGDVITLCGKNFSDMQKSICFFNSKGELINSYPKKRLLFISPDGKIISAIQDSKLFFLNTMNGELIGKAENISGVHLKCLSNVGFIGSHEKRFCTIKTSGQIEYLDASLQSDSAPEIISHDGRTFYSFEWKQRKIKKYQAN